MKWLRKPMNKLAMIRDLNRPSNPQIPRPCCYSVCHYLHDLSRVTETRAACSPCIGRALTWCEPCHGDTCSLQPVHRQSTYVPLLGGRKVTSTNRMVLWTRLRAVLKSVLMATGSIVDCTGALQLRALLYDPQRFANAWDLSLHVSCPAGRSQRTSPTNRAENMSLLEKKWIAVGRVSRALMSGLFAATLL
jgi:hypothetical protein